MAKIQITIDQHPIAVFEGATILEAAQQAGIPIPTMCHVDGLGASTSCFLCLVHVEGMSRPVTACSTPAKAGMVVFTDTPALRLSRRTCLELLLSDHLGDCRAPCQLACPADIDIQGVLASIKVGNEQQAVRLIREATPFSASLARLCPRPCEDVCRRSRVDEPLAICALLRFISDRDLTSRQPYLPSPAPDTGQRIAVIGAGPAGLSTAYHLRRKGHAVTVLEQGEAVAATLRWGGAALPLAPEVLSAEIQRLADLGVMILYSQEAGSLIPEALKDAGYAAIFVDWLNGEDIPLSREERSRVDPTTLATSWPGVFAEGQRAGGPDDAVRAVGTGRLAAFSIDQYVRQQPVVGYLPEINSSMGELEQVDSARFQGYSTVRRAVMAEMDDAVACAEAARCLECGCAALQTCKLRVYAATYGARPDAISRERRGYTIDASHPDLVMEAGKCVLCGACVRACRDIKKLEVFTFMLRGYETRVAPYWKLPLAETTCDGCLECVRVCPTGALVSSRADKMEKAYLF